MDIGDAVREQQESASVAKLGPVWIFGLLYVVATFLAFPHPVAGRVIDLGLIIAPLAPMGLILAIHAATPRVAMKRAFGLSMLGHYALFHWFFVVTHYYGHAPVFVGVLAPLVPALFLSLGTILFAGVWSRMNERGVASPLVAAVLWTAIDHLRGVAFGGFPWATLGYAQHLNPLLMGLAPIFGVYGLSFVVALLGAGLAQWFRDFRSTGARRPSNGVMSTLR